MAEDESIRVLTPPAEGRLSDLLRGPVAPGIRSTRDIHSSWGNVATYSTWGTLNGILCDLMGFYSDLAGFYSDLLGFYSGLMGYSWDIPSGRVI